MKLVYHGLGERGDPMWAPPTDDISTCPHPRTALRFDPRYAVPCYCYCRACGQAYIHPQYGMTQAQIDEARTRAAQLKRDLGW